MSDTTSPTIHSTGATVAGALIFGLIGVLIANDDVDQPKWKIASKYPNAYTGIAAGTLAVMGGLIARGYSAKPNPAYITPTPVTIPDASGGLLPQA